MTVTVWYNRNAKANLDKLIAYLTKKSVKFTELKYKRSGKPCGIRFNTSNIALISSLLKSLHGISIAK